MTTLECAVRVAAHLNRSGVDAYVDIGQQGWPATVAVAIPGCPDSMTPSSIRTQVRRVDPASERLPLFGTGGKESIRLTAARACSSTTVVRWLPSR